MRLPVLAFLIFVPGLAAGTDLDRVKAEPNLEKRSKLALDNAGDALKKAREAYKEGDLPKTTESLAEMQSSVALAEASLKDTGKNPRKSPKWFKKAEIETRDLLRKLSSFSEEMSVGDRSVLDSVKTKVQQVHDDLLMGIMEGKPK